MDNTETVDGELEDAVEVQASPGSLMQLSEAEVNRQILTARAYPRSITGFRRQMREMVTYDKDTAESCLYAYKRGIKLIQGPSINFAMSAVQCWGNVRTGSMIVSTEGDFVTAQGFFWDMEKNMAVAFQVLRRITSVDEKTGQRTRYSDDMIMVTGNAAGSIAMRNAILKGIPKTAWRESYEAAKKAAVGEFEHFATKRTEALAAFQNFGVDKEQVFGLLGVKGVEDVTYDHLMFLAGVHNAIKEGDQKAEDIFAVENMSHPDQVKPGSRRAGTGNPFERNSVKAEDPKPEATKTAEQATQKTAEPTRAEDADKRAALVEARADEVKMFVRGAYDDLMATTKVRDVPMLQERIIEAGVMDEAQEKDWIKACDARIKEIMDAAKRKPK